jgi:hypothetical protein
MVVRESEQFVATWPITGPPGKIFRRCCWALALARLCQVRSHPLTLVQALSIALALATPLLAAVLGVAIALAGVPTPPATCLEATGFRAIARLRMRRPEETGAAFEQTTAGPPQTALWTVAAAPDRMTMVHGSWLLPLFKSRSETSTSLRGVYSRILSCRSLMYEMCQSRVPPMALGPGPQRAFGPFSLRR